jgi:hypothetical protein
MLPILRIIPVGGVLLAIMILVLSLSPPSGMNPGLMPAASLTRGALMQLGEHPEWRQFLFLAATRRADELNSLRDLPDMPVRAQSAGKTAGLPAERSAAEPDDETGSINPTSTATIPIEIGEPSSTELPVTAPAEIPPVIKTPERVKAPGESHKRGVRHARHPKALAKTQPKPTVDPLEALFGAPQNRIVGPQPRSAVAPSRSKGRALASQPAADPATTPQVSQP